MVGPHLLLLFGTGNQYDVFVHQTIVDSLLPDNLVYYLVNNLLSPFLVASSAFTAFAFVESGVCLGMQSF